MRTARTERKADRLSRPTAEEAARGVEARAQDIRRTLATDTRSLRAELPLAAVVIEARYSALCKLEHVDGNWLADQLARLEVRYPQVHLVFADSRRYAEDWTYRFLTTALAETTDPSPNSD